MSIKTIGGVFGRNPSFNDVETITIKINGVDITAAVSDIAGLAVTDGNIIVGDGTNWVAESGATARTSLGLGSIATQAADSVDIDGGNIDGATIATSDITVGSGKTLDVSAGTLTLANNQISGDKVEGGTINALTVNQLTISASINTFRGTTGTIANGASETIIASAANYATYLVYGGGTSNTSAMGFGIAQVTGGGTVTVTQLSGGATGFTLSGSGNDVQITNNTSSQAYSYAYLRLRNWR